MYHLVKRLGIPDSQIILMLADDVACNARNPFKTRVLQSAGSIASRTGSLYGAEVQVDYRGSEVTVEALLRVLTGKHAPGTPASRRLDTNERSNVFLYMSGHGGEGFIKFQDVNQLSEPDLADAFTEMKLKGRFNELFLAVDTCHAASLCMPTIRTRDVVCIASAGAHENSFAREHSPVLGQTLIDRFTAAIFEFMERVQPAALGRGQGQAGGEGGVPTLQDLFEYLAAPARNLISTPVFRTDLFTRDTRRVPVTDFFGAVPRVRLWRHGQPLALAIMAGMFVLLHTAARYES